MTPASGSRGVLILAGGRGERFWPWSTPERPKQLLPLAASGKSLLAATFERALELAPRERIVVITSAELREASQRECPGIMILGEPMMRNTTAAIAAGAAAAVAGAQVFSDEVTFAVLPADHAIEDTKAFGIDIERAYSVAEKDPVLVTFGIRPTEPSTSFGYIRRGARLGERLYRVAAFTEKPDSERASAWTASGEYFWNSGMFVWKKRTFMNALEAGRPEISSALRGFGWAGGPEAFSEAIRPIYERIESISVDYAVIEKAPNTVMLEALFDWDDLGSWSAWARHQSHDARGNVRFGDAIVEDCDGCVVVGDGGIAAALGLRDMVVVHANGATLSCPLGDGERVRKVAEAARARERAR